MHFANKIVTWWSNHEYSLPRSSNAFEKLRHNHWKYNGFLQNGLSVIESGHIVPWDTGIALQYILFQRVHQMGLIPRRIEHLDLFSRTRALWWIVWGGNFFNWRGLLIVLVLLRRRFLRFLLELQFAWPQAINGSTFANSRRELATAASLFIVLSVDEGNRSISRMLLWTEMIIYWGQRRLYFWVTSSQRRNPTVVRRIG